MKRRCCDALMLVLFAAVAFWPLAGAAQLKQEGGKTEAGQSAEAPAYDVPQEKKAQWESLQNLVEKEYNVCIEHCGNETSCLNRCETAYKTRLDREYHRLMYDK